MALPSGALYRAHLHRCRLYSGFIATSLENANDIFFHPQSNNDYTATVSYPYSYASGRPLGYPRILTAELPCRPNSSGHQF